MRSISKGQQRVDQLKSDILSWVAKLL